MFRSFATMRRRAASPRPGVYNQNKSQHEEVQCLETSQDDRWILPKRNQFPLIFCALRVRNSRLTNLRVQPVPVQVDAAFFQVRIRLEPFEPSNTSTRCPENRCPRESVTPQLPTCQRGIRGICRPKRLGTRVRWFVLRVRSLTFGHHRHFEPDVP